MKSAIAFLAAALLLAGGDVRAQASAEPLPACAEGGIARVAVTIPAGQSREQVVQALQQGGALPAGTQVKILSEGERPALVNLPQFEARASMHMERFARAGLQVDGPVQALLEVNADGVVTEVHPETGNRDLDRGLRTLWRAARYAPVVVGSCRVPAWLHVDLEFASEYGDARRWQQTRFRP